ncbi:MAG: hypothetical protein H0X51_00925 [Parachlamydiaceae bacterium]|nr:hypothetical protein [Parachlamydiaceae bacterium]
MSIGKLLLCLCLFVCSHIYGDNVLSLRDNLKRAHKGDFIVTLQNKNYTLLHIYDLNDNEMVLEEVTVPAARLSRLPIWREWLSQNAPGHTCWVLSHINLNNGQLQSSYSVSQRVWLDISQTSNFLPVLLNLKLQQIPHNERQKIGSTPNGSDRRPLWQPKMVVEGQQIQNVAFSAWRTRWPRDNSPLSGKLIEVYVPEENDKYPSYFPYWLQVKGMSGSKATIHVVDSGSKMVSPAPPIPIKN